MSVYLEVLSRAESLELLPTVPVGWIAYVDDELPQLVLVNFAVSGEQVMVRTGYGSKLAAAKHGVAMTFGASHLDAASRTGWSVTVSGRGQLLDEGADLADPRLAALQPWAPGDKEFLLAIPMRRVTGRRLRDPTS